MRTSKDWGVQTDYVKVSGVFPADDYVYKIQLKNICAYLVIKRNSKAVIVLFCKVIDSSDKQIRQTVILRYSFDNL